MFEMVIEIWQPCAPCTVFLPPLPLPYPLVPNLLTGTTLLTSVLRLFERGAACVGLDFMSHPFWDKYIDFEERLEAHDRVFALLGRIIHIPLHQYARYFERFRQLAQSRPLNELVPSETLAQFRAEIEMEAGPSGKNETEMDRELRSRIDRHHLEIFNKTQNETTQRWPFEQQIKRPYFHVTDIDDEQLGNWRKYLEFEENEGNRERIIFLYERCVAAAAYYEEFWLRYTRWMLGQMVKADEIRFIYIRASCYFVPIARPMIRLQWALFEEREQRVAVAQAIYESMLLAVPDMVEAIVAWANSRRRHSGLDAAVGIYQDHVDSNIIENAAKASLIAEWAKLLWNAKRSPEEARQLFQQYQHVFTDNKTFWDSFLTFEMEQSLGTDTEDSRYNNVKSVIDEIRKKSNLPADAVRDLGQRYMNYLLERGTKDVAKEYLELDRLLNHG